MLALYSQIASIEPDHSSFLSYLQQLDPTIEGAKAAHDRGLEQTMFDRLTKMVLCHFDVSYL